jgi:membrane-bound inhibitor of C-type lysozyme
MKRFLLTLALASMALPAQAVETRLQLVIEIPGNAERNLVRYQCEGQEDLLDVSYLNAEPNYLALLDIDGEKRIFVSAITGSGARYTSGEFTWSTKGAEGSLQDELAGEDAAPRLTCLEVSNTP